MSEGISSVVRGGVLDAGSATANAGRPADGDRLSAAADYLDADVCVGRLSGGGETTPGSLLAEMDRVGVSEALVHHQVAREHHAETGNALAVSDLAASSRLKSVWVVLPHHTGEMAPPDDLVAAALSAGVRSVRLFPSFHGHRVSLRPWVIGDLLGAIEDARMPLFLDFQIFRRADPPWDDIIDVCQRHPKLKVILTEVQGRNNRTLYPLLSHHASLYVKTSGFNVHRGIEDICNRFGPERLIFGSGYPTSSMGAARFHLDRAQISDADRQLIGAGNMRRLLSEVPDAG